MFKKIVFSLVSGIFITLFFAQYSSWVHHECERMITQVFVNFGCKASGRVVAINFFLPQIVMEDITVEPQHKNKLSEWAWTCKRYTTGFSWLNLLLYGSIDMWVRIDDLDAQSQLQGTQLAIAPHVIALLSETVFPIPIFINAVALNKANLHFQDKQSLINGLVAFNSEVKNNNGLLAASFYFTDGNIIKQNKPFLKNLLGQVKLETRDMRNITVRTSCKCQLPHLGNNQIVFTKGTYKNGNGRFSIRNADDSWSIDPIIMTQKKNQTNTRIHARIPLLYCTQFLLGSHPAGLHGTCQFDFHGCLNQASSMDGHLVIEDIIHDDYPHAGTAKITFKKRNDVWDGALSLRTNAPAEMNGTFHYDEKEDTGACLIKNDTSLALPHSSYWEIAPQDLHCTIKKNKNGIITSSYQAQAENSLLKKTISSQGIVSLDKNKRIHATGMYDSFSYACDAQLDRFPYVQTVHYKDEKNNSCIGLQQDEHDHTHYKGHIQFPFVKTILKRLFDYDVQGQGTVSIDARIQNKNNLQATVELKEGTIRLPQTYNFIDTFKSVFHYDYEQAQLIMSDLLCLLHTGRITSKRAVIIFDDMFKPTFVQVPFIFDHCLINVKKDLFAMISGSLRFEKQINKPPLLHGNLFVDRAQVKENIFSNEFQKQLFMSPKHAFASDNSTMQCNLTVETTHPIGIDTPMLETSAYVNLHIKDNITKPKVSGLITLREGSLRFGYKPLFISTCSIMFVPDQLFNPLIELVAKNKIKKHQVQLQVTGTLKNHQILLSASPPLSDEQIMTLLLVGSHEDTLNVMAPALLAQNVKQVLFGTRKKSVFNRYFKHLPKPFNIQLVPSFTDQTGRGGLRATLEIDVNEHWRALIQKNFSLTEDTRFELEYLFSDDITFRAIRDERRDIGGEVEMKWKF